MRKILFGLIISSLSLCAQASPAAVEPADSLTMMAADTASVIDSVAPARPGLIRRIADYFKRSNHRDETKPFDVSFIGGPHYSSDTGFGIGLVAAGFYRSNRADTLSQPSNVSLYADVSTSGFYLVGLRGDHLFDYDRRRIDYNLYFYSFPRDFWGIGYRQGNNMDNKSRFKELYVNASVDFLWRVAPHFYAGPAIEMGYVNARRRHRPELWNGQRPHIFNFGAGFRAQLDTRDNLTAPGRGLLLQLEQRFCPRFLGNDYAFSYTDFRACVYTRLWRDATFAARYHTRLGYGNVPWNMMSTFGGSSVMRGYYEGRYRDKGEMDLTVELRQHVWRRNGVVLWLGAGTVYPKLSKLRFKHILPNGGIGYRWEFKQLTNVRVDFGLARGEHAFIFSINEAF